MRDGAYFAVAIHDMTATCDGAVKKFAMASGESKSRDDREMFATADTSAVRAIRLPASGPTLSHDSVLVCACGVPSQARRAARAASQ